MNVILMPGLHFKLRTAGDTEKRHLSCRNSLAPDRSLGIEILIVQYMHLMQAARQAWRGYESMQKVAKPRNMGKVIVTRTRFLDVSARGNYELALNAER
jgi:hypothetical protein